MSQSKRNAKADSARSPAESNPAIIGVSDSLHSGLSGIKLIGEGMNCMTCDKLWDCRAGWSFKCRHGSAGEIS